MSMYPFIEAEQAEQGNVVSTCRLLEVSRSAYYSWHTHTPTARQLDDQALGDRIVAIHTNSRSTYGVPRVHAVLRAEGVHVGRKRVARLMVARGLAGRCKRPWKKTTIADPDAETKTGRPGEEGLRARHCRARPHLRRRHHLYPHLAGLGLPGQRHRPGQSTGGGLGTGRSHACSSGLRRTAHGHPSTPARPRSDVPLG